MVDIGERHHRAYRTGAADHDVGVGQCDGQIVKNQCGGHHALLAQVCGEALRARQGPVDDVHAADAGPYQMRRRQRAHRSGADHRGGATGQPGQAGAGHVERHRHHRRAGRVDTRLAVHALADRQRALREFVQGAADGVIGLGGGIGAAHLTQDLLFTDHRGVQARGDGEQVLDGGLGVTDVGVLGQVAHRHAGVVGTAPGRSPTGRRGTPRQPRTPRRGCRWTTPSPRSRAATAALCR